MTATMKCLCRLCSSEDEIHNLHDVFSTKVSGSTDLIVDILYWTFSVEISVTDKYPKAICTDCKMLIECVMEVKNAFQNNQKNIIEKYSSDHEIDVPETTVMNCDEVPLEFDSNKEEQVLIENTSDTVRVKISTLEEMCPLVVIRPFEASEEYNWYKPVGSGSFKKRKYRHFQLNESLLEDICQLLGTENNAKVKNNIKSLKFNGLKRNSSRTSPKSQKIQSKFISGEENYSESPKVWLEPVEYLMAREKYKKIANLCYTKHPSEKNTERILYKMSDMRKSYVCDLCGKSFLCQISLNIHQDLKHGQTTHLKRHSSRKRTRKKRKRMTPKVYFQFSDSESFTKNNSEPLENTIRRRFSSRNTRVINPFSMLGRESLRNSVQVSKDVSSEFTYAWEKKTLGIYSAINFCNNKLTNKCGKVNGLVSKRIDLDETVRKLTNRLDEMIQS